MREVLQPLVQWWREGKAVGMGTVVATFRSAPRPPGAPRFHTAASSLATSVSTS